MSNAVLGVDTGTRSLTEVDHLVADLGQGADLGPDAVICTHMVRTGTPHYAVSVTVGAGADLQSAVAAVRSLCPSAALVVRPGEDDHGLGGASLAAAEALARSGGRAVRYPGVGLLVGEVAVGTVLASTAIEEIQVLGGAAVTGDDVLETRGFVRPWWRDGRLVLQVCQAGPGRVAPFEVPDPTPCCGDHPV